MTADRAHEQRRCHRASNRRLVESEGGIHSTLSDSLLLGRTSHVFRFLAINVKLVSLRHDRALERLNFFVSQRCFRFQSVEDFRCAVVMNSGVFFDAPSIYGFAPGFSPAVRWKRPRNVHSRTSDSISSVAEQRRDWRCSRRRDIGYIFVEVVEFEHKIRMIHFLPSSPAA